MRAVWAAVLAVIFAVGGVYATGGRRGRTLIPVSGLLLAAVACFGLIPEIVDAIGWQRGLSLVALGYVLLWILDKRGVPVCPSCSHGHAFSAPLVAATAAHAFVDGWGMVAVGTSANTGVSMAISTAILLHKIPEGLALGTMLRQSNNNGRAILLATLAEFPTIIGGAIGMRAMPGEWLFYPLALAGGTFLFLGLHAVVEWWKGH